MGHDAKSLMQACSHAIREGASFDSIWKDILKGHGMVESPPIQVFDDTEASHIDVRLNNGFWLRYSASSNDFSLRRGKAHRCF